MLLLEPYFVSHLTLPALETTGDASVNVNQKQPHNKRIEETTRSKAKCNKRNNTPPL